MRRTFPWYSRKHWAQINQFKFYFIFYYRSFLKHLFSVLMLAYESHEDDGGEDANLEQDDHKEETFVGH